VVKLLLVTIICPKNAEATVAKVRLFKLVCSRVWRGPAWLVGRAALIQRLLVITIQLIYSLMVQILLA
jgi:hypothetical protein